MVLAEGARDAATSGAMPSVPNEGRTGRARTATCAKTPSQERIERYLNFAHPRAGTWLRQMRDAPAHQQRWLIRVRLECNATWARKDPDHCACGARSNSVTHNLLHCRLLDELRPPLTAAFRDFVQNARFAGNKISPDKAAAWIHTGKPAIPPSPQVLASGQRLRQAACAFSAKATRVHTDHLSSTRAAAKTQQPK